MYVTANMLYRAGIVGVVGRAAWALVLLVLMLVYRYRTW